MATIVYSTVNASLKHPIDEGILANIIKSKSLPDNFFAHLCTFFTDVPVSVIIKFIYRYKIELKTLEEYYYKHIRKFYQNKELEEVFV